MVTAIETAQIQLDVYRSQIRDLNMKANDITIFILFSFAQNHPCMTCIKFNGFQLGGVNCKRYVNVHRDKRKCNMYTEKQD